MSYARLGDDSDVYVYLAQEGYYRCCWCTISDDEHHRSTMGILAHLREHRARGDKVPDDAFTDLKTERDGNDAWLVIVNSYPD